jgi:predicted nucleic acid-binding protein
LESLRDAVISPLVDLELCSLVALKVRTREMTQAAAQRVLAQFREHLSGGYYDVFDIGPREYDTARTWLSGRRTALRPLDALHLACAFGHGQTIWTTDRPLARAAGLLGVECTLITR